MRPSSRPADNCRFAMIGDFGAGKKPRQNRPSEKTYDSSNYSALNAIWNLRQDLCIDERRISIKVYVLHGETPMPCNDSKSAASDRWGNQSDSSCRLRTAPPPGRFLTGFSALHLAPGRRIVARSFSPRVQYLNKSPISAARWLAPSRGPSSPSFCKTCLRLKSMTPRTTGSTDR